MYVCSRAGGGGEEASETALRDTVLFEMAEAAHETGILDRDVVEAAVGAEEGFGEAAASKLVQACLALAVSGGGAEAEDGMDEGSE